MTFEQVPSLRIRESDGSPNVIPVYNLEISGGTVIQTGPTSVRILMDSGGTGSGAPTDAPYLTYGANGSLSAERVVAASDNITIVSSGTSFLISAVTNAAVAGPAYARTGNTYVVITLTDDLTAERSLSGSSGLTLTDGGAGAAVHLSVNTNVRDKVVGIFFAGSLSTVMMATSAMIYIPFNMQIQDIRSSVSNQPVGANILMQPTQWNAALSTGTGMFQAANRPFVYTSNNVGSHNGAANFGFGGTLFAGSWLGVNLDQIGSTNPGSNLTINFIVRTS